MKTSYSQCGTLAIGILAAQLSVAWADAPKLPGNLNLDVVRAIPVQHDGRWMPMDTLARDMVWSTTGKVNYRGQDPMLWLLAWTFDPQTWADDPLIGVGSAELRGILELPANRTEFSFSELVQHKPLRRIFDDLARRTDRKKMNPLESKATDIRSKLVELQNVFQNEVMLPVPNATDAMAAWTPIELPKPGETQSTTPVQTAWSGLQSAFLADNATAFADASRRLSDSLARLPAAHRPTAEAITRELRYNRLQPYSIAWKLMALGAIAAAVAVGVQRRWMDVVVVAIILAGFGTLTYGIWLRGQIAGHLPAANMFESLLFLSWGGGAFAVVSLLVMRDRLVPLTAVAIGALALSLADLLPIDHFIRPIAPVLLDTVWMSIHVPGIMVSYAVLALTALIAHTQIAVMALAPKRQALIEKLNSLHYWYMHVGTILLGAGIMTGSMWAAASWGRYWGWDPKEVWSLVAFLAYMTILHVRVDRERTPTWVHVVGLVLAAGLFGVIVPKLAPLDGLKVLCLASAAVAGALFVTIRGPFAMAFKSAVAFWSIIMTYVGVNYVLGSGLHSYGFGTGAVVHYMLLIGSIDLSVVGLLTVVYLVRSGRSSPASGAQVSASATAPAGVS